MSKSISSIKSTNNSTSNKDVALDYNPIYKVNYLVNDSIDTIIIFYGKWLCSEINKLIFKKSSNKTKEFKRISFAKK